MLFYILRGVTEGIFSRTAVLVSIKVSINLLNTLTWKELDTSLDGFAVYYQNWE